MKRNKEEEAGTVPGDLLSPAKRDTDGQEQNENNNLKNPDVYQTLLYGWPSTLITPFTLHSIPHSI